MVEKTVYDLLGVEIDSRETKFLNATTVYSFQATGPNGEIIFNSSQSSIPGFIADTASLAITASYAVLAGNSISSSYALTASHVTGTVISASYALSSSYASQAGNSSTINVNVFSAPVDSYLLMSNVAGTTGVAIGGDADLRYNTSTNVLTVPNISATTLTGSLLGTASNAISALTASFYEGSVTSASYAATASLALRISASSINSNNSKLYGSSNVESIDWNARVTYDTSNIKSINWDDRALFDTSGTAVVNWTSGVLTGTGSLQGTSSWATNALTASRVPSYETAWISYTPTWTTPGTQPVLGDGTLTGAYKQIGKTVFVRVRLVFGTTTTGGTGDWQFGLPVSASDAAGIQFPCSILDAGNAWYQATVNGQYSGLTHRSSIIGQTAGSNSSQGITSTFPITWGNSDSLQFNGSYEAA